MIPSAFDEENCILDPPRGMSNEDCLSMSVWVGPLADGSPAVISCWKVTAEELEEIKRTGRVWLMVLGSGSPPMYITASKPFEG